MYAKRNARGQDWNWLMLLGEMDFGIGMATGRRYPRAATPATASLAPHTAADEGAP